MQYFWSNVGWKDHQLWRKGIQNEPTGRRSRVQIEKLENLSLFNLKLSSGAFLATLIEKKMWKRKNWSILLWRRNWTSNLGRSQFWQGVSRVDWTISLQKGALLAALINGLWQHDKVHKIVKKKNNGRFFVTPTWKVESKSEISQFWIWSEGWIESDPEQNGADGEGGWFLSQYTKVQLGLR